MFAAVREALSPICVRTLRLNTFTSTAAPPAEPLVEPAAAAITLISRASPSARISILPVSAVTLLPSPTRASVSDSVTSTPSVPAAPVPPVDPESDARMLMRFSFVSALTSTSRPAVTVLFLPMLASVLLEIAMAENVPPAAELMPVVPATSAETAMRSETFFASTLMSSAALTRMALPMPALTLLPVTMAPMPPPTAEPVWPLEIAMAVVTERTSLAAEAATFTFFALTFQFSVSLCSSFS